MRSEESMHSMWISLRMTKTPENRGLLDTRERHIQTDRRISDCCGSADEVTVELLRLVRDHGNMDYRIDPSLIATGSFSAQEVEAFRGGYERQHGVRLNDDQAARFARSFVLFVAIVCRAVRPPQATGGLDESVRELN